jgi:hypothetical protein
MKNHVVIFCENKSPDEKTIYPDSKVFCLPFIKIQEAMEFCHLEEVYSSYIGFRDGKWQIDLDNKRMRPCVKIDRDGISEKNKDSYIWVMKRINPPQAPYKPYQFPAKEPPNFQASFYDSKYS